MWALLTTALAFEPGTAMPAPVVPFVQASEQLVLSDTTLSFTRLDGGAPLLGFRDRFTIGLTGRVAVSHANSAGRSAYTGVQSVGLGVWFGWHNSDSVHHGFGLTVATPPDFYGSTYGLILQEATLTLGPAYRLHVSLDRIDIDATANAYLNPLTIFGGDLGLTATYKLSDDRLGLQLGALGGLTDFAWVAPGVRMRPVPELEIGLTGFVGIPVLDTEDPVHVSPMLLVRFDEPGKRAVQQARPVMDPVR